MNNYGGLFFLFLMGDFARARALKKKLKNFRTEPLATHFEKKKKTQQSDILWTHPEGFFFFRILSREFSRARERQRKNTPKTPLFEVFFQNVLPEALFENREFSEIVKLTKPSN